MLMMEVFSVADQMVIDGLDERTRAVVERYVGSVNTRADSVFEDILADEIRAQIDVRRAVRNASESVRRRERP